MKRNLLLTTMTFFLLFTAHPVLAASQAQLLPQGAYVNGVCLPAYHVDGKVCVIAEQLEGYGFSIHYDDALRTLDIYDTVTLPNPDAASPAPLSNPTLPLYETDIVTQLSGIPVESYNANGYTLLPLSSLTPYGVVTTGQDGVVSFISTPAWHWAIDTGDPSPADSPADSFTLTMTRDPQGIPIFTGENIHLITPSFAWSKQSGLTLTIAIYQNVSLPAAGIQTNLLSLVSENRGEPTDNDPALLAKQVHAVINDVPVVVTKAIGGGGNSPHRCDFSFR
ncbi:MAG TPA: hypothetical protein H9687_01220 [Firmicutes bacterium]|nr:hypothetical protein [Bacillota bacterium]